MTLDGPLTNPAEVGKTRQTDSEQSSTTILSNLSKPIVVADEFPIFSRGQLL